MGRRLLMSLVIAALTLGAGLVYFQSGITAASQALEPGATVILWEYQTEVRRGPAQPEATRGAEGSRGGGLSEMTDRELNALGRDGWELGGLTRREIRSGDQMQTETVYIFKRPRGERRR